MRRISVFFVAILATSILSGCNFFKGTMVHGQDGSDWAYSSVNDAVNGRISSAKKKFIAGQDNNSVTMVTFTCHKPHFPRSFTITIGSYYDDSTNSNHMMSGDPLVTKSIAFNLDSAGKSTFQDSDNTVPDSDNLSNEITKQFLTLLDDSVNKQAISDHLMQIAAIAQLQRSTMGDDPRLTDQEKELDNSDVPLTDNYNFNYKTLAFNIQNTHGSHTISINMEDPAITNVANDCGWSKHSTQQTTQPSQEPNATPSVLSSPAETQAASTQNQGNPQDGATATAAAPAQTFRPSFECRGSLSTVEKFICGDAKLSQQDVDLSRIYNSLRGAMSGSRFMDLKNGQKQWMIQRTACNNVSCLENMYDNRIGYLRDYASN